MGYLEARDSVLCALQLVDVKLKSWYGEPMQNSKINVDLRLKIMHNFCAGCGYSYFATEIYEVFENLWKMCFKAKLPYALMKVMILVFFFSECWFYKFSLFLPLVSAILTFQKSRIEGWFYHNVIISTLAKYLADQNSWNIFLFVL